MDPIPYVIGAMAGLIVGGGIAYALLTRVLQGKAEQIIKEAGSSSLSASEVTPKRVPGRQGL